MYVWIHTQSPPQHIAMVQETTVGTAEKLGAYMRNVNANRRTNLKWGGVFENDKGETTVNLFWERAKALEYVKRNRDRLSLIIATEELAD